MCCEDSKSYYSSQILRQASLLNVKIMELRTTINYTQRYASFGTESSEQNARITNARTYYV